MIRLRFDGHSLLFDVEWQSNGAESSSNRSCNQRISKRVCKIVEPLLIFSGISYCTFHLLSLKWVFLNELSSRNSEFLFHSHVMLIFFIISECSALHPCDGLNKHAHFHNFGMAFLTLFRVATGDNWNGIMKVYEFRLIQDFPSVSSLSVLKPSNHNSCSSARLSGNYLWNFEPIIADGCARLWHADFVSWIVWSTELSELYLFNFPFNALTLLVGRQEGHLTCKKLGVGLLVVTIWLELCTSYSSSCHHHLHRP